MKTLAIVIPAYNEAPILGNLITQLPNKIPGIDRIIPIIIDDGSTDNTPRLEFRKGTIVARHPINLGVGCATRTGFAIATKYKADVIITMDGDGQHSPRDIENLIRPILRSEVDVAFGNRLSDTRNMPTLRKVGNRVLNLITFLTTGLSINDSQCGYRAYSAKAIKRMKLNQPGFEICSEIVAEVKRNKLKFIEVPVKTIYKLNHKHSQNPLNAFNILLRMVERLLWS